MHRHYAYVIRSQPAQRQGFWSSVKAGVTTSVLRSISAVPPLAAGKQPSRVTCRAYHSGYVVPTNQKVVLGHPRPLVSASCALRTRCVACPLHAHVPFMSAGEPLPPLLMHPMGAGAASASDSPTCAAEASQRAVHAAGAGACVPAAPRGVVGSGAAVLRSCLTSTPMAVWPLPFSSRRGRPRVWQRVHSGKQRHSCRWVGRRGRRRLLSLTCCSPAW